MRRVSPVVPRTDRFPAAHWGHRDVDLLRRPENFSTSASTIPHPARYSGLACTRSAASWPADPSIFSQQLAETLDGLYRIVIGFLGCVAGAEAARQIWNRDAKRSRGSAWLQWQLRTSLMLSVSLILSDASRANSTRRSAPQRGRPWATRPYFNPACFRILLTNPTPRSFFGCGTDRCPGFRRVNQNVVAPVDSPDGPPVVRSR